MAVPKKVLKRQTLRNIEYYGLQEIFDELYQKSLENRKFRNLMELILMEENIKLAYRNMKKNDGSTTPGVDGKTIEHLAKMTEKEVIELVRNKLEWYTPKAIRRVEIDKGNGKKRPLGIASIEDRLIQQCILQVIEPICEAKFHDRSNGFRPNRGVENALAQAEKLIQSNKLYIVVDIDIKGFFDNVSHGKLLKQLWTIGIQDKKLISIISAMLKGEIAEIGFPEKGTAQGSIISPLLSNVVLNELDWWIASQWEFMPTRHVYKEAIKANGTQSKSKKYRALRNSTLKECFIVRYADDFKIFCRKHKDAVVMFEATKQWLKTRLGLDISPEKSKIVNLKHSYSEFLGFRIKVHKKGKDTKCKPPVDKYVVKSHISEKALKKILPRTPLLIDTVTELFRHDLGMRGSLYTLDMPRLYKNQKYLQSISLEYVKKIIVESEIEVQNLACMIGLMEGKLPESDLKIICNNYSVKEGLIRTKLFQFQNGNIQIRHMFYLGPLQQMAFLSSYRQHEIYTMLFDKIESFSA